MKTYHEIALRDIKSAKIMLEAGIYNNAVRFCQQYVEKIFKHRIESSGYEDSDFGLMHTHRVQKLARRCEQLTGIAFTKDELLLFSALTDYYFDTNYPSDEYVEIDKETAVMVYEQVLALQEKYEHRIV